MTAHTTWPAPRSGFRMITRSRTVEKTRHKRSVCRRGHAAGSPAAPRSPSAAGTRSHAPQHRPDFQSLTGSKFPVRDSLPSAPMELRNAPSGPDVFSPDRRDEVATSARELAPPLHSRGSRFSPVVNQKGGSDSRHKSASPGF